MNGICAKEVIICHHILPYFQHARLYTGVGITAVPSKVMSCAP